MGYGLQKICPKSTQKPAASAMPVAVLGGLADVERDLIRTRTAEASIWGDPLPSLRRNRQKPGDAVLKVRHSPS